MHTIHEVQHDKTIIQWVRVEAEPTAQIISIKGSLEAAGAKALFSESNLIEMWLATNESERLVFDLFDLEYINSTAVGYLMKALLKTRELPVTYIFKRDSLVYFVLDNLGFFEFHDLHIQEHPLTDGLDPHPQQV